MGEHPEPGSSCDWLRFARSDLALSRTRKTPAVLYEHLCFHAQQASEKSLKALLVAHGIKVPRTHDIAFLLDQLPGGVNVPPALLELPTLTKYAVQQRYPGEVVPATRKDHKRAVDLAEHAIEWAAKYVAKLR